MSGDHQKKGFNASQYPTKIDGEIKYLSRDEILKLKSPSNLSRDYSGLRYNSTPFTKTKNIKEIENRIANEVRELQRNLKQCEYNSEEMKDIKQKIADLTMPHLSSQLSGPDVNLNLGNPSAIIRLLKEMHIHPYVILEFISKFDSMEELKLHTDRLRQDQSTMFFNEEKSF